MYDFFITFFLSFFLSQRSTQEGVVPPGEIHLRIALKHEQNPSARKTQLSCSLPLSSAEFWRLCAHHRFGITGAILIWKWKNRTQSSAEFWGTANRRFGITGAILIWKWKNRTQSSAEFWGTANRRFGITGAILIWKWKNRTQSSAEFWGTANRRFGITGAILIWKWKHRTLSSAEFWGTVCTPPFWHNGSHFNMEMEKSDTETADAVTYQFSSRNHY